MTGLEGLYKWLDDNLIQFGGDEPFLIIGEKTYGLIEPKKLFGKDMKLMGRDVFDEDPDYYVYEFGGQYFYSPSSTDDIEFNILRYSGSIVTEFPDTGYAHLGIHGGYEMMSGLGDYDDWCKKAAFMGCKALGIAEKHTLAGAAAFQSACDDHNIQPVIGETISISFSDELTIDVKIYVIDGDGWYNLLVLHKLISVDGQTDVSSHDLATYSKGLLPVISYGTKLTKELVAFFKDNFIKVFYQIDSVQYDNEDRDVGLLKNVRIYLDKYMDDVPPILINDTYYLEAEDRKVRKKLLASAGLFAPDSYNQHFKTLDESFADIALLFDENDERLYILFESMLASISELVDTCEFKIEFGKFRMPEFTMDGLPERFKSDIKEDLFWELIEAGVTERGILDNDEVADEYMDRLDTEAKVIKDGGFIDYFLILWDIVRWSQENDILTGIGRGSAGGSLIAYLLGITQLDPLRYGLLFERFLNAGRIGKSLPDIDVDFEGDRRDDVKRYMERKYGVHNVCSVGTYSKLRVKAALKELVDSNTSSKDINYVTSLIKDRDGDWDEIFKSAVTKAPFKTFVKNNINLINNVRVVLGQPKTESIHACATIISPNHDEIGERNIYTWFPVKKRDGILISEWEGEYLEKAGFLKEDILGVKRLDQFKHTIKLIRKELDINIDIHNREQVPLDNEKVYELFALGYSEDTFHFGTSGMKVLLADLKPVCIDDMIDTNALHRPALMDIGAHIRYVQVRFGEKSAEIDWGLDDIVQHTNGIIIYQEQVMQAVQKLGGFTLVEADNIRKAMGKKKPEILEPYKDRFIEHLIGLGCPDIEAGKIWHKLELFAGYGFNRSHAAAYSITGYISQWFKVVYPAYFWTTAFEFADDSEGDIPRYMAEIRKIEALTGFDNNITCEPPDVNVSEDRFVTNFSTNTIHWSLLRVREVGSVAVEEIMTVRGKNGKFFSMKEFFKRVQRKKVNKKVVDSLIMAGCFDAMYDIKEPKQRVKIFNDYIVEAGHDKDKYGTIYSSNAKHNFWWAYMQKYISGLGDINYKNLMTHVGYKSKGTYADAEIVNNNDNRGKWVRVGGIVTKVEPHSKKDGSELANVLIETNYEFVWVTLWTEVWLKHRETIAHSKNSILLINGRIQEDKWKGLNVVETNEKGTEVMLFGQG